MAQDQRNILLTLEAGDYALELAAARGGSVARFDWRGLPLFRPSMPGTMLHTACFPLVPFSNRIGFSRFRLDGREVTLTPNMPEVDPLHVLHGYGWLREWRIVEAGSASARLLHHHERAEWPWSYEAEQTFELSPRGLRHGLILRNLDSSLMPAGIGFHPYFPRDQDTIYRGLHRGEWQTGADGLPGQLLALPEAADWWAGKPIGSRAVDTVYAGRKGPLVIDWPSRQLRLSIIPSTHLGFTVVYTPAGQDYFCVEPVSHLTGAINRSDPANGLRWLAPGEILKASVLYQAHAF